MRIICTIQLRSDHPSKTREKKATGVEPIWDSLPGRSVEFIEATFGHSLGPGVVHGIALRRGREEVGEPFFPPRSAAHPWGSLAR